MKLVHEEKGMTLRYIPAPRGNMHRLMERDSESGKDLPKSEGVVKPFYMSDIPYSDSDGKMKVHISWLECLNIAVILSSLAPPNWLSDALKNPRMISNQNAKADIAYLQTQLRIRIPTEYEWEWAAMGGEDFEFAGCTNWAKTNSNREEKVKQKCPNGYGLYDMTRSEWEFTSTMQWDSVIRRGGNFVQQPFKATVNSAAYGSLTEPVLNCGVRFCIDADKVN